MYPLCSTDRKVDWTRRAKLGTSLGYSKNELSVSQRCSRGCGQIHSENLEIQIFQYSSIRLVLVAPFHQNILGFTPGRKFCNHFRKGNVQCIYTTHPILHSVVDKIIAIFQKIFKCTELKHGNIPGNVKTPVAKIPKRHSLIHSHHFDVTRVQFNQKKRNLRVNLSR